LLVVLWLVLASVVILPEKVLGGLEKKTVHAVQDANEKRVEHNEAAKQRSFTEDMQHKNQRRSAKGVTLAVAPKVPQQYANMTAEEASKHCGVFSLRFGRANDLVNLDSIGKSDPYTKIYFCDCEGKKIHYFKTHTIDDDLNPIWNLEDITIHYFPGMSILFKVFDEDTGRDELEGIARISFDELFSHAPADSDFKEMTLALTVDDSHLRSNSASSLLSPTGISKKKVKGTVTFSYAYCSDELLKLKDSGLTNLSSSDNVNTNSHNINNI